MLTSYRSGCGGGWAKACEKLKGLKYATSGLGQGKHTLAVRNLGYGSYPGDPTFFGKSASLDIHI